MQQYCSSTTVPEGATRVSCGLTGTSKAEDVLALQCIVIRPSCKHEADQNAGVVWPRQRSVLLGVRGLAQHSFTWHREELIISHRTDLNICKTWATWQLEVKLSVFTTKPCAENAVCVVDDIVIVIISVFCSMFSFLGELAGAADTAENRDVSSCICCLEMCCLRTCTRLKFGNLSRRRLEMARTASLNSELATALQQQTACKLKCHAAAPPPVGCCSTILLADNALLRTCLCLMVQD